MDRYTRSYALSPPIALAIALGLTISGALLCALAWTAWVGGPLLEARFFPILITEPVADSVHGTVDGGMCWTTRFHKLRDASPAYVVYLLDRKLQVTHADGQTETIDDTTPVLSYRVDDGGHRRYLSKKGFTDDIHVAGARWSEEYCLERPHDLALNDAFTVHGEAEYDVSHGLWRVPAPMPTFRVTSLATLPRGERE